MLINLLLRYNSEYQVRTQLAAQSWFARRLLSAIVFAIYLLTIGSIVWKQTYMDQHVDEYAVYTAVLKQVFFEHGFTPKLVLINEETIVPNDLDSAENQQTILGLLPDLEDGVLVNFLQTKDQRLTLRRSIDITATYKFIGYAEQQELDAGTMGFDFWSRLDDRYPEAFGIIRFSRVAFNSQENQALVFTSHQTSGRSGWGSYFLLIKENGHWVVKGNALGYISERYMLRRLLVSATQHGVQ